MKILVTGGAGFIGSCIVDELIASEHEVVVMDNLSTGDKSNVNKKAKFYEIDILSNKIFDIFKDEKFDVVFHLAASVDVRESIKDPIHDAKNNISGILNILEACRKTGVYKFVFSSTGGALYGNADIIPTPENYPTRPISPYGVSKLSSEEYLYYYSKIHNINVTILRYSNVYGPRQGARGDGGVVSIFIKKIINGEQVEIYGDGEQVRDFVFVDDVARANVLALSNISEFDIYNIGSGVETNINKLQNIISSKLQTVVTTVYRDALDGEVFRSVLNNAKAINELNWSVKYDLAHGIEKTIRYFNK